MPENFVIMERNVEIKNFIANQDELSISFAKDFLKYVHEDLLQIKAPHFDIAFRLWEAKTRGYAELLGYTDIYDLADKEFGLGKTSVKNYISVAEAYMYEPNMTGVVSRLYVKWEPYSFTQLVEMLSISAAERSLIKPEMTVKQIREWKQNHRLVEINDTFRLYGELSDKEKQQYENSQLEVKENDGQLTDQVKNNVAKLEIAETPVVDLVYKNTDFYVDCSALKNIEERRVFIEDFEKWGIWFTVPELNLTYYRYSFLNGAFFVVSQHLVAADSYYVRTPYTVIKYHLVDDTHSFDPGGNGVTLLVDYLTKNRKILNIKPKG